MFVDYNTFCLLKVDVYLELLGRTINGDRFRMIIELLAESEVTTLKTRILINLHLCGPTSVRYSLHK